jgi:hypothetical protein
VQPADGVRCGGNMRVEAGPWATMLHCRWRLSDECLSLILHCVQQSDVGICRSVCQR